MTTLAINIFANPCACFCESIDDCSHVLAAVTVDDPSCIALRTSPHDIKAFNQPVTRFFTGLIQAMTAAFAIARNALMRVTSAAYGCCMSVQLLTFFSSHVPQ